MSQRTLTVFWLGAWFLIIVCVVWSLMVIAVVYLDGLVHFVVLPIPLVCLYFIAEALGEINDERRTTEEIT